MLSASRSSLICSLLFTTLVNLTPWVSVFSTVKWTDEYLLCPHPGWHENHIRWMLCKCLWVSQCKHSVLGTTYVILLTCSLRQLVWAWRWSKRQGLKRAGIRGSLGIKLGPWEEPESLAFVCINPEPDQEWDSEGFPLWLWAMFGGISGNAGISLPSILRRQIAKKCPTEGIQGGCWQRGIQHPFIWCFSSWGWVWEESSPGIAWGRCSFLADPSGVRGFAALCHLAFKSN